MLDRFLTSISPICFSECENLILKMSYSFSFCTTARFTVGGNQISGQIVTGLGGMSKLEYIWLFENDLTGGIPTEIGLLENLIAFDAVGNDLTGGLPTTFTALPNLQVLQLGDNPNLGGTIPTGWVSGSTGSLWRSTLNNTDCDGFTSSNTNTVGSLWNAPFGYVDANNCNVSSYPILCCD